MVRDITSAFVNSFGTKNKNLLANIGFQRSYPISYLETQLRF